MNLYNSVYQLLRDNDCVIIPGFGGFVANCFEAKADLRKQEFFPPSRRVAFNEGLQNNDGLLMNYLCQEDKIDWDSANNYVKKFVSEINLKLEDNQQVKFENLGVFSKKSGNLVFVPANEVNLLDSSYGLTRFDFPMISSDKGVIKVQSQKPVSQSKSAKLNKKKKSKKPIFYIVTAAAVLVGLTFVTIQYDLVNYFPTKSNVEQVNIIPVDVVANELDTNNTVENTSNIETNEVEVLNDVVNENNTTEEDTNLTEETTDVVVEPVVEIQETVGINSSLSVHVIAGSFSNKINAQNLQESLNDSGFVSQVLPQNNGMYRVTVKSYASQELAVSELESLRSQANNSSLWVMYW